MDNMLLFPGAIAKTSDEYLVEIMTAGKYHTSFRHKSKVNQEFKHDLFERQTSDLSPVPITPDLLGRLEGPNGQEFRVDTLGDWFLGGKGHYECLLFWEEGFGKWKYTHAGTVIYIQYVHQLQNQLHLNTGILLTLKD